VTDVSQRGNAFAWTAGAGRNALIASGTIIFYLAVFALLFWNDAVGAFRVWTDSPTFNHCFLVLPISVFMVWQRRQLLEDIGFLPDMRSTVLMLALAAAWLAASLAGILEAGQFIVLTMIQVALFSTLGAQCYRRLAAPFLYLYFLVPSGAFLIPGLQAFTAKFSVIGLHILGIPVFSNGAVIEVPAGTFAVAEACAGLRFLIAAVAFGVFFAIITYRSWARRLIFVALSTIVPVIANGFRALGLIAAAQWIGNPAAALADHIIYGWLFFSFVLVSLILIGQLFSDRRDDARPPSAEFGSPATHQKLPWRIAMACLANVFAAASGPATATVLETPHPLFVPEMAPQVALPWREVPSNPDWKPIVAAPTRSFLRSFRNGTYRIDEFVALYGTQQPDNNLVRSNSRDADERKWSFDSSRSEILTFGDQHASVRVSRWIRGAEKRDVWSFYDVRGQMVPNIWNAKWEQLRAYMTGSRCLPAFVALSADVTDEPAYAAAAGRLLAATEPLNYYLCKSTKAQASRSGGITANSTFPRRSR
jgi:exosortase A